MKIYVNFSELKRTKKLRELGRFFAQNNDFVIEIDQNLDSYEKVYSFVEEMVHFLVRLVAQCTNKKVNVLYEEQLAKLIAGLIFTKICYKNRNKK